MIPRTEALKPKLQEQGPHHEHSARGLSIDLSHARGE